MDEFQKQIMIGCTTDDMPFTDEQAVTFATLLIFELRATKRVSTLMREYVKNITHQQYSELPNVNHFVTWISTIP